MFTGTFKRSLLAASALALLAWPAVAPAKHYRYVPPGPVWPRFRPHFHTPDFYYAAPTSGHHPAYYYSPALPFYPPYTTDRVASPAPAQPPADRPTKKEATPSGSIGY